MSVEPNEVSTDDVDVVLRACDEGNVKYLAEFVISGGELRDLIDSNGRNALHHCVDCSDESNRTNLETAHLLGQLDRVKCAKIIMKTSPELMECFDSNGWSPLHLAVVHNDLDFLRAMLEFESFLAVRTYIPNSSTGVTNNGPVLGRTAIHFAVLHQKLESLAVLVQAHVKPWISFLDYQGATALHYAVQLPSPREEEAIRLLVNEGQADINEIDSHGRTPLIWAATIGAPRAVALLLRLGAKLNIRDECGLTALHCASSRGNAEVVQCLLNWITTANMDDPSQIATFRDVPDKDGCSPLFYSVTLGHSNVTSALLAAGANVHTVDRKGRTLAHCLARIQVSKSEAEDYSVISQLSDLVSAGMELWNGNQSGATPLHEACLLRNAPLVSGMTNYPGFDDAVHVRDAQGHTPLHLVVAASWSEDAAGLGICRCLLRHKADVNATTELPQGGTVTALDLAIMNETEEGVSNGQMHKLLVSFGAKKAEDLTKPMENVLKQVVDHKEEVQNLSNEMGPTGKSTLRAQTSKPTSTSPTSFAVTEPELSAHPACEQSCSGDKQPCVRSTNKLRAGREAKKSRRSRAFQTNCEASRMPLSELYPKNSYSEVHRGRPRNKIPLKSKPSCSHTKPKTTCKSSGSTTSSSVRVATPTSSDMDHACNQINQRRSRSTMDHCRRRRQQEQGLPVNQDPKICTRNLERILPIMLDRYMHRQDWECSPLTGRYKMAKPTLSPYLVPLVPSMKGSLSHSSIQSANQRSHRRSGSGTPCYPDRKAHSSYAGDQQPKSHQTSKHEAFECNSNKSLGQPRTKSEYYKLLQDLANLELQRYHPQKLAPIKPIQTPREFRKKPTDHATKYSSAMGGELSPAGRREVSVSPELDTLEDNPPNRKQGRRSR
ncbi:ankyrin-2 [Clonorchis sinensis]|uniref:Ankyrin-2 n=1 Tax=Clonorchis sinensis TaxID=79923 RepID=H2KU80_CLOSI|nr:ankyrin-2 [Clonorchis sinensis]